MTFAIIETGAKQYRVEEGDVISIEKIQGNFSDGDKVSFDSVVLTDNGSKTILGTPFISGKTVEAVFVEEGRGKKIRIQKFKSKSNYHKIVGHRQSYFKVKITKI